MQTQHCHRHEKAEQLTDAFRIFNEVSEQLAVSYQGLEEQVKKLHLELAFAHSERLSSLEEKEKLAARLAKIMAALPAGVCVLAADGRISEANAVAEAFFGEALSGKYWTSLSGRYLTPVYGHPQECLLADGTRVNMSYRQLPDNAGQIILLTDVTAMRMLQDSLNQQKHLSAMGEMVASLAHQVRTPLATAILYASQMANPAVENQKRQQFSEKILERLHHLEGQVNDMLSFAKQGRLVMATFSLTELLGQLRAGVYEYARQRRIDVQIFNEVSQEKVLGNHNALRGALMNILYNAVDAVGSQGLIQLRVRLLNETLQIAITDNGPGIADSERERIFEPFCSTKANGTGLGLAVVDRVMKAHGGGVAVHSKLDVGSTFTLTLPFHQASATTTLPKTLEQSKEMPYERL